MKNPFGKMRAIPDSVLGPTLQNHQQVLQKVVYWIEAHNKRERAMLIWNVIQSVIVSYLLWRVL